MKITKKMAYEMKLRHWKINTRKQIENCELNELVIIAFASASVAIALANL